MSKQGPQYRDIVLKSPREVVYLEYTPSLLPPKPAAERDGAQWTRFVCVSDTHSRAFSVPDGDVLLHSGDLTNTGTVADFEKTMEWLYGLPHPVKM
jgi:3',5'-cyclic AMP phosphodiesterase CpdA